LVILTSVDKVCLNYMNPNERPLSWVSVTEAKRYMAEGHFPQGSMGPKIGAAIQFMEAGGKQVIITSPGLVKEALEGKAGTKFIP
jgi:carbamate kinase